MEGCFRLFTLAPIIDQIRNNLELCRGGRLFPLTALVSPHARPCFDGSVQVYITKPCTALPKLEDIAECGVLALGLVESVASAPREAEGRSEERDMELS